MPLESVITSSPYLTGGAFRDGWARREKCICRILLKQGNYAAGGTGFLVGPDTVLTCFHVLQAAIPRDAFQTTVDANQVHIEFDAVLDSETGEESQPVSVGLAEDWILHFQPHSASDTNDDGGGGFPAKNELDYALIRIAEPIGSKRGWIKLSQTDSLSNDTPPKKRFLAILQHPGLREQAAAFDSELVEFNGNGTRLRYQINTEPGSSGSPCFDKNWNLVAMHHAGAYQRLSQDRFNQGIPINSIVQDLLAAGFELNKLLPPEVTGNLTKKSRGFDPTLIIVCSKADEARAHTLCKQAEIPPRFIAQIGNTPPAIVSDNAIAVYLGSDSAVTDPDVLKTITELRDINLQVIPVLTNYYDFESQTPLILQKYNASEWPDGTPVPQKLSRRIRQLLGLEVAANDRSVFISYFRKDSRNQIVALSDALRLKSYSVFVDLEDLPIGEPVQKTIDDQISKAGSRAVLYIETPNAHQSKWIHDELLWAYTREIAIVICQAEMVRNRIPVIGSLPVLHLSNPHFAASIDEIVKYLDYEIAQTNTRNVQLARTLEGIVKRHSKAKNLVGIESLTDEPSMMALRYNEIVENVELNRNILVKNSARSPTTTIINKMVERLTDSDDTSWDGGILLYDTPGVQLPDYVENDLNAARGQNRLWWIPREYAAEKIPQILDRIV